MSPAARRRSSSARSTCGQIGRARSSNLGRRSPGAGRGVRRDRGLSARGGDRPRGFRCGQQPRVGAPSGPRAVAGGGAGDPGGSGARPEPRGYYLDTLGALLLRKGDGRAALDAFRAALADPGADRHTVRARSSSSMPRRPTPASGDADAEARCRELAAALRSGGAGRPSPVGGREDRVLTLASRYEPSKILSYLGNSSMRRVRSDVSHRIRRQPSIFSARVVPRLSRRGRRSGVRPPGRPVGRGLARRATCRRRLFLLRALGLRGQGDSNRARGAGTEKPGLVKPVRRRRRLARPAGRPPRPAGRRARRPTVSAVPGGRDGRGRVSAAAPSKAATPEAAPVTPRATRARPAAPPEAAPASAGALAALPAVYWVQVGAFLDPSQRRQAGGAAPRRGAARGDDGVRAEPRALSRAACRPRGRPVPSDDTSSVSGGSGTRSRRRPTGRR